MLARAKLATLAIAAALFAAPVATAQDDALRDPFAAEILAAHNADRAEFGTPALLWSDELAREAQGWANRLARERVMRHASHRERKGRGENLWMGTKGHFGPSAMVGYFSAEKRHFVSGTFPNVSRTGNWADVGHYTQIVWPETREVGCATARNRHHDVLVCRYWPAGNVYGTDIAPRTNLAQR